MMQNGSEMKDRPVLPRTVIIQCAKLAFIPSRQRSPFAVALSLKLAVDLCNLMQ